MSAESIAAAVAFVTLLATTGGGLLYVGFQVGGILSSIDSFKTELLKCQGASRLVHEVIDRRLDRLDTALSFYGERIVKIESKIGEA